MSVVAIPAELAFTVTAVPKPQGSKRAFMTRPKEGSGKTPKAVVVDSDKEPLKYFREAVRSDAVAAQQRLCAVAGAAWRPFSGPVHVELAFALPKPKSAPKTRRTWPVGKNSGDLDKLTRSVFDALTDACVWDDDALVVRLVVAKDYPGTAEAAGQAAPGVSVRITAAAPLTTIPAREGDTLL